MAVLLGALGMPSAAADTAQGFLRVAHLSPDSPAVDVALAPLPAGGAAPLADVGPDVATGLTYGDVSAYTAVPAGSYAVSLRPAGSPASTPPSLTVRVDVPAGQARTVAVSGPFADLALHALADDLTAPPSGTARVRVVSATAGAGPVDVGLQGGPPLATALAPGAAAEAVDVPAGPAAVTVDGAAAPPLEWAAGSVTTLLVLDAAGGGLTVRPVLDAAGPAVAPAGSVEAGGGGTAGFPSVASWLVGALGLLGAVSRRGRVLALAAAAVVAAVPFPAAGSAAPAAREETAVPLSLSPVPRAPAAAPVRLRVPAAGIDSALTGVGLDGAGALAAPSDGTVAGWYRGGPAPGDTGPAVVAGHVDSTAGPAVFFRLRDLAVGDAVSVTRTDGTTVRFTVTRVARYPKDAFPAAEVYGPTPDAELRLITCGGAFDRTAGSYLDNVVVFARSV